MKLVSHYFEQISGIEFFPIIVLVLFFSLFVAMIIVVLKENPKIMEKFGQMPLDNSEDNTNTLKP